MIVATPLIKTTVTSLKQLTKQWHLLVAPSSHKSDGLISPILPRLPIYQRYELQR